MALAATLALGQLSAAAALDPARAPGQYRIRVWRTDRGLPVNSVHAIAQDLVGFLWLGTEEGLVRFDGVAMEVFDRFNTPELGNHMVQALTVTEDGTVWIGTQRGVVTFRDERFAAVTEGEEIRNGLVLSLYPATGGGVWVGTTSGLGRIRAHTPGFEQPYLELADAHVRAVRESGDGTLWVGTRAGLVTVADGVVHRVEELPEVPISDFFEDSHGVMWVATNGAGLAAVGTDGRIIRWTRSEGLPLDNVLAVTGDDDGNLWIGTNGVGLVRFRDGLFDTLDSQHGLAGDLVRALSTDADGNLWVGTMGGGLSQLSDCAFSAWTAADGLAAKIVLPIFEASDGAVWFGTAGGGVSRMAGGTIVSYGVEDGLPHGVVLGLAETAGGDLWFGTAGGGLARRSGGKFERVAGEPELGSTLVTALYVSRDGVLWIGTAHGGISSYDGRVFQRKGPEGWLAEDSVYQILEASDGAMWVAGNRTGLYRLSGHEARNITADLGDPKPPVLSLLEVEPGVILAGTGGHGLVLIRGDSISVCTRSEGLGEDVVMQLLEDGLGFLWMGSNRGIFRLRRDDLMGFFAGDINHVSCDRFDTDDGLPSVEINAGFQPSGFKTRDGRLWFPTAEGAASVDPKRLYPISRPPAVAIRRVHCGGPAELIDLAGVPDCTDRSLTVEYTGFSYTDPEGLAFRYRLQGFDADWVEAGERRTAYYTNLPPGAYSFEVTAETASGTVSTSGARFRIRVPGRFYESALFYIGCALVAAAAGWQLSRQRVSRLTRRQDELEQLIRDREQAESALHTSEARLRQAQKLEALGRLAGGIAHDFNNLLMAINANSELLLMTMDEDDPGRDYSREILKAGVRAAGLTRQLLAFSRRQPVSPTLVDLNEQLRGISKLLERVLGEDISLVLHQTAGPLSVTIDTTQFEQVILNLAVNARDAMASGGRLTIHSSSLDLVAEAGIDLPPGRYVRLAVEDDGAGMDEHTLERAFEPFFTTKEVGKGTGLGLATVYGIVRQAGGTITVRSAPGRGSVFTILLPACEQVPDAADAGPAQPVRRVTARVLVVEDDPLVRRAVVGMLKKLGATVDEASGPAEARQSIADGTPIDVVVSDVVMPGGYGDELARELRALRPGLKVILMSGHATEKLERHGAGSAPFVLLHKPFTANELADAVTAAVG